MSNREMLLAKKNSSQLPGKDAPDDHKWKGDPPIESDEETGARMRKDLSARLTEIAEYRAIKVSQLVERSPLREWAQKEYAKVLREKADRLKKEMES